MYNNNNNISNSAGAWHEEWDDLSSILNSVVLSSSKDRWTCDLSGDGEFKVKVIRNFIDDLFLPSSDVATRWVKFIPIKVNVFSWRARRDRLPTRVNLSRRGVLLDSHLCPLCNAAMEDVQHVFFRCDVARVVLRKICRWWDLDWQEICSFSDWDAWFLSFRLSSRLKSILEGVFYVAWWRIWRLRNQLVFDASPPNRSTIFDDILGQNNLGLSLRRIPRGGIEQSQLEALREFSDNTVLVDSMDRWSWSLEGSGNFSVASVRREIDKNLLPMVSSKTRWVNEVPKKVNIHAWKVKLDCLPTRLNISRRGMSINSILCPNCDKEVESSSHIFFSCQFAREIFARITSWWEVPFSEISSYDEWFLWLMNLRLPLLNKQMLEGVCYTMWWNIWSFRNKNIFGLDPPKKEMIFDDIGARMQWELKLPLHSCSLPGSMNATQVSFWGGRLHFREVGEQICKFGKPQGAYLQISH
ncbi:RNA-directed DNA polymerase, eukaryota [Tanacetum coccineum]